MTWQIFVDTGGTFTDGLGLDPQGRWHRAKVLSSSALRATVASSAPGGSLRYQAPWTLNDGFADGAQLRLLRSGWRCRVTASQPGELELAETPPNLVKGEPLELSFEEQSPLLVARLLTGAPNVAALPPLALRLATTRGTNALLERRGAPVALLITEGFADLLAIGDQQRPDLFALAIEKSQPLYQRVIEVPERLGADGAAVRPLALDLLAERLGDSERDEAYAVALLHSYLAPGHELAVERLLRSRGAAFVSRSAELAPAIELLARARTAVVDAYLAPILRSYLDDVRQTTDRPGSSLLVMTSAGGLEAPATFRAKDSLLSGPAGGVVGAAAAGRAAGYDRLIGFDMGGTSTDVCRYAGELDHCHEHRVGDARLLAPALTIETVAAGGGSICTYDGRQWRVGPRSAGADPGPACYGNGGPLTITDVNLLLGRLVPAKFAIPIDPAAAAKRLAEQLPATGAGDRDAALLGLLRIANERMAEAIRRISIRQGHDPATMALLAFGGAGGQHACEVAELLGMTTVILPADAGLLSARGLAAARRERWSRRPVLAPWAEVEASWRGWLDDLVSEAIERLAGEQGAPAVVRRRSLTLRLSGQEHAVELEVLPEANSASLARDFCARYAELFGYPPPLRPIEMVEMRVLASSTGEEPQLGPRPAGAGPAARPAFRQQAFLGGGWHEVPVYENERLAEDARIVGPALVVDAHASLALERGWQASKASSGALVARCVQA